MWINAINYIWYELHCTSLRHEIVGHSIDLTIYWMSMQSINLWISIIGYKMLVVLLLLQLLLIRHNLSHPITKLYFSQHGSPSFAWTFGQSTVWTRARRRTRTMTTTTTTRRKFSLLVILSKMNFSYCLHLKKINLFRNAQTSYIFVIRICQSMR